jgi:hypothetical protein
MEINAHAELLNELYAIDPSLRERETELVVLLEEILKHKPDVPKDPGFLLSLREQLLKTPSMPAKQFPAAISFSLFRQFALVGAGAALALVIALPLTNGRYSLTNTTLNESFSLKDTGAEAFGKLSFNSPASPEVSSIAPTGRGGGGGGTLMSDSALSSKLMAPYSLSSYVYKGKLSLEGLKNTVYRRNGSLNLSAGELANATIGPVNLSAFPQGRLQNFSLTGGENGYSIYVGDDGSVSVNANQGIWSSLYTNASPVTKEELPTDEEAIAAADAFIKAYGIDTNGYGAPVLDTRPRMYAMIAEERGETPYYPDTLTVTYPFILDGEATVDQGGTPQGISVNVHSRTKTVTGLYVQSAGTIERSSYELESDAEKILSVLKKGGLYSYSDPQATVTEVEVGDPEFVLMSYYQYDGTTNRNLYVPALKFTVLNPPKDGYAATTILVPLPKDILESQSSQPGVLYKTGVDPLIAE